ncbi:MAG: carbamoyltransferase HypF [Solirubrobacterales bacterium]
MTMTLRPATAARRRVEVQVRGVVQGVGFRPFVYRLAAEHGLAGFVHNDDRGVVIEVEGEPREVTRFLARLESEPPPLARVEGISPREVSPRNDGDDFAITASQGGGEPDALVSADTATCADCLAEVFDPGSRRHRYPFTNCTNCGPRFTIVTDVPYDRPLTTMAGFAMCERCRAEYEDPGDRRFHAQPNACPECGPTLRLVDLDGSAWGGNAAGDVIARTAAELLAGRIIAIKGIGGFHLACLAADEETVGRLRARKHREDKPFALMAPSTDAAQSLVDLTEAEVALLEGAAAPIVIARRRADAKVARAVAPSGLDLGVMLPYSPMHHLLAADVGEPLVMTSANISDEPIAYGDEDALARLGAIADLFCVHDRPIQTRTDDSVVRSLSLAFPHDRSGGSGPLFIRRSRGYVPAAIALPAPVDRPILACGAELKSVFCLAKGGRAWPSHHIGDLKNYETLSSYREGIENFQRLFAVEPEVVAHDLHPDYLSTSYALAREGVEHVAVQHHHAHLASVLAEHGVDEAVGAIFDGAGLGPDGTVWGGELLVGGAMGCERRGLLFPVRLPGGDAATREPWRMACTWLAAALEQDYPELPASLAGQVEPARWKAVSDLIRSGVSSPLTTSTGRLFDGVAAICGLRAEVSFEGQAAAELEGVAVPQPGRGYPMPVIADGEAPLLIDARETIRAIIADIAAGESVGIVSGRFHEALATATAEACGQLASERGIDAVVLSGGVFQNRPLLERTVELVADSGLRPLIPRLLPPNDGGIAFGQVAVAAAGGGVRA